MSQKEPPNISKARILLVDDDQIIQDSLSGFLTLSGYEVQAAGSTTQALDCLKAGRFDMVISDISMPDHDGLELLRRIRTEDPDIVAVMITGYGTIESAVEAIKLGAFDYLTKPIIDDELLLAIERGLGQRALVAENRRLRQALAERYQFPNVVGQDFRMAKVFEVVQAVADTRTTVLITGESGTGKSIIARAIHAHSSRQAGPFVEVSCGALPETLLESELFGHVRGAFTGAVGDKMGKFASADGGTIFLDEISTASPGLQIKLLRVIQERQFEPIGSNKTQSVDVRIVLASNRDLTAEVTAGRFRGDLYYRINVVNIELPPLRQRLGDITLLADHFLKKFDAAGRIRDGISQDAMVAMQRHSWPGNVRELENCIERAVVLCRQSQITVDDLPPALRDVPPSSVTVEAGKTWTLQDALAVPERQIIMQTLVSNNGSRQLAAAQLGINRCTLYKKMKKYGLLGQV